MQPPMYFYLLSTLYYLSYYHPHFQQLSKEKDLLGKAVDFLLQHMKGYANRSSRTGENTKTQIAKLLSCTYVFMPNTHSICPTSPSSSTCPKHLILWTPVHIVRMVYTTTRSRCRHGSTSSFNTSNMMIA